MSAWQCFFKDFGILSLMFLKLVFLKKKRVIYCSIRLHHWTIHSHLILLCTVQRKVCHIPNPLLYLPLHWYHQLAPCLHCQNPHHQAHPQQVWCYLTMALNIRKIQKQMGRALNSRLALMVWSCRHRCYRLS